MPIPREPTVEEWDVLIARAQLGGLVEDKLARVLATLRRALQVARLRGDNSMVAALMVRERDLLDRLDDLDRPAARPTRGSALGGRDAVGEPVGIPGDFGLSGAQTGFVLAAVVGAEQ